MINIQLTLFRSRPYGDFIKSRLNYRIEITINPRLAEMVHREFMCKFGAKASGGTSWSNDMKGHIVMEFSNETDDQYIMALINDLIPYDMDSKY